MPARKKRSPPLVTIDREAWRKLAKVSAAKDVEQWGFICGRRTSERPACFRVSKVVTVKADEQTKDGVRVAYPRALKVENDLRASKCCDDPVGSWHTHVFDERCAASIMPQMSDVDKQAVTDEMFVIICATYPLPPDPMKKLDKCFSIRTRVKGKLCRAEAWLRVGGRFKPCEIKVR